MTAQTPACTCGPDNRTGYEPPCPWHEGDEHLAARTGAITEETWQQAYGEGVSFEDMMAARALIVTSTRTDERERIARLAEKYGVRYSARQGLITFSLPFAELIRAGAEA